MLLLISSNTIQFIVSHYYLSHPTQIMSISKHDLVQNSLFVSNSFGQQNEEDAIQSDEFYDCLDLAFDDEQKNHSNEQTLVQKQIPLSQWKDQNTNPQFEATIYQHQNYQDTALHDYQRSQRIVSIQRFNQSCFVYRNTVGNDEFVQFISQEQAKHGNIPHQNAQILFHIKLVESPIDKKKKFYYIQPEKITQNEESKLNGTKLDKRIFKCIRNSIYSKETYHIIEKDDQFKIGLETFKVAEIQKKCEHHRKFSKPVRLEQNPQSKQISKDSCKICLSNENQHDDPLINPCQCKGSCQYVHVKCLKAWMNIHLIQKKRYKVSSYLWEKFQCEICKQNYPSTLNYQNQIFKLIDYETSHYPFFVLERMRQGSRKKIIVITKSSEPLRIGRKPDADIRVDLNSVSRDHASIYFTVGQFILKDQNSRYGTLVRVKDRLQIDGKLKIQVGDIVIRFDVMYKVNEKEFVWRKN